MASTEKAERLETEHFQSRSWAPDNLGVVMTLQVAAEGRGPEHKRELRSAGAL